MKTTKRKKGKKTITTMAPIKSFLPKGRANKSKTIVVETFCHEGGRSVLRLRLSMTVHFDKLGRVEYRLSDLNGDGKKDGKQLNEF